MTSGRLNPRFCSPAPQTLPHRQALGCRGTFCPSSRTGGRSSAGHPDQQQPPDPNSPSAPHPPGGPAGRNRLAFIAEQHEPDKLGFGYTYRYCAEGQYYQVSDSSYVPNPCRRPHLVWHSRRQPRIPLLQLADLKVCPPSVPEVQQREFLRWSMCTPGPSPGSGMGASPGLRPRGGSCKQDHSSNAARASSPVKHSIP